jgi:hypothetical protein
MMVGSPAVRASAILIALSLAAPAAADEVSPDLRIHLTRGALRCELAGSGLGARYRDHAAEVHFLVAPADLAEREQRFRRARFGDMPDRFGDSPADFIVSRSAKQVVQGRGERSPELAGLAEAIDAVCERAAAAAPVRSADLGEDIRLIREGRLPAAALEVSLVVATDTDVKWRVVLRGRDARISAAGDPAPRTGRLGEAELAELLAIFASAPWPGGSGAATVAAGERTHLTASAIHLGTFTTDRGHPVRKASPAQQALFDRALALLRGVHDRVAKR